MDLEKPDVITEAEESGNKKRGLLYHFPLWCIVPFFIALLFLAFHMIS